MKPEAKRLNGLSKRDYWEKQFVEWEKSGLTQSEYQARHGLSQHVFVYWKKKLKSEKKLTTLVPVSIQPDSRQSPPHECTESTTALSLHFDGGIRLDIKEHFNPETLRRVMSVIGRV